MSDTCAYCPRPATTKDHLIPKSVLRLVGLSIGPRNLVPACYGCNQIKGSMLPSELRGRGQGDSALAVKFRSMAEIAEGLIEANGLGSILEAIQPTPSSQQDRSDDN